MKNNLNHIDNVFSSISEGDVKDFSVEKGWREMKHSLFLKELLAFNFVNVKNKYIYALVFVFFLLPPTFINFYDAKDVSVPKNNQLENLDHSKENIDAFINQKSELNEYDIPKTKEKVVSVINIENEEVELENIEFKKVSVQGNNVDVQENSVIKDFMEVTQITTLQDTKLNAHETPQLINDNSFNDYNKDKQWLNSHNIFSVSLEVGYILSWSQITSDEQYEGFKNYRIDNERSKVSPTYGLRFNYQYKNWIFSTGLDYFTVTEELNYGINETIVDPDGGYFDIDTLTLFIVGADNNLVPMILGYDKTWIDEYKEVSYDVNHYNKYSYIEIPVSVGYKFCRKRFSISSILGVSLGYLYHASGKLLINQPNGFVDLNKNSMYLNKKITNLNLALSFEYSLTPNYGIYAKASYKHSLSSTYKEYPLTVKPRAVGVKFGINIYL